MSRMGMGRCKALPCWPEWLNRADPLELAVCPDAMRHLHERRSGDVQPAVEAEERVDRAHDEAGVSLVALLLVVAADVPGEAGDGPLPVHLRE